MKKMSILFVMLAIGLPLKAMDKSEAKPSQESQAPAELLKEVFLTWVKKPALLSGEEGAQKKRENNKVRSFGSNGVPSDFWAI